MAASVDKRLAQTFVELADTLVAGFDLMEFLHTLTERCVELPRPAGGHGPRRSPVRGVSAVPVCAAQAGPGQATARR